MRFAYADPPYLGKSKPASRHYGALHAEAGVYDTLEGHAKLVARLTDGFPDGWAMSLSSPSLRAILPLCPDDVRVMAWVKTFAVFKPGVNPCYAWEPVIVRGGRKRGRGTGNMFDWVSAPVTLTRKENFVPGSKPARFSFWLFSVLNVQPEDELLDLFPGSGAVTSALDSWRRQMRLA